MLGSFVKDVSSPCNLKNVFVVFPKGLLLSRVQIENSYHFFN